MHDELFISSGNDDRLDMASESISEAGLERKIFWCFNCLARCVAQVGCGCVESGKRVVVKLGLCFRCMHTVSLALIKGRDRLRSSCSSGVTCPAEVTCPAGVTCPVRLKKST
jgi:hypothetical protein